MLVTRKELKSVLAKLAKEPELALDTETTGLRPWQGDRLFSIIIASATETFYFNFQEYPLVPGDWVLPRATSLREIGRLLARPKILWYLSNAKFDMGMLAAEGLEIAGEIWDIEAIGRVEKNNRFRFGLAFLAKEIGDYKDDAVKEYIKKNKLYRIERDASGEEEKIPEFNKVPLDIMRTYAEQDARATFNVGKHQGKRLEELHKRTPNAEKRSPLAVAAQERAITKVFFDMERVGVRVNREYSLEAANHWAKEMVKIERRFKKETGLEFVDSSNVLSQAFKRMGFTPPLTKKGNPSFTDAVLEGFKNSLAERIREYRHARKMRSTYFLNFLYYADSSSIIHPNMRQGGTETGRISYSNPNLQNVPKLDKKEDVEAEAYPVRRAFEPREGFFYAMLDFDQMEYALLADVSGEMGVIEQMRNGVDFHQATATMMGVSRRHAKTINFMLLYGGGIAKLAATLFNTTLPHEVLLAIGRIHVYRMTNYPEYKYHKQLCDAVPQMELEANIAELCKALDLLNKYFEQLPRVKLFTKNVQQVAKDRGFIVNWMGRHCNCARPEFAYALPNHYIQGGCADIVKKAMVELARFLEGKKSRMVLQIHDEILFEIHFSEQHILPELQRIMAGAYPAKHLPMTCGIDYSLHNWQDKKEWNGQAV